MVALIFECSVKEAWCGSLGYGVHKPVDEVKASVREHGRTGGAVYRERWSDGAIEIHSWTEVGRMSQFDQHIAHLRNEYSVSHWPCAKAAPACFYFTRL